MGDNLRPPTFYHAANYWPGLPINFCSAYLQLCILIKDLYYMELDISPDVHQWLDFTVIWNQPSSDPKHIYHDYWRLMRMGPTSVPVVLKRAVVMCRDIRNCLDQGLLSSQKLFEPGILSTDQGLYCHSQLFKPSGECKYWNRDTQRTSQTLSDSVITFRSHRPFLNCEVTMNVMTSLGFVLA